MVKVILSGLIFFIFLTAVRAQDTTRTDKKVNITPLPVAFYTPETRFGFGGLVTGIFNLGENENTRVSNVQVLGAYTINNQVIAQVKNNIFTKGERYNLFGELSYFDFPILYYGIGNDSREENEEDLEYQVITIQQRVLRKVADRHFAGFNYRGVKLYDLTFEPEFLVNDLARLESDVGFYSGLGFSYVHDSRDNVLNAYRGMFIEFSTLFNGDLTGSDFTFSRYRFDARKYWKLKEGSILATEFFGVFTEGDVPFRELAQLGGDQIMRGYYRGRFMDKNYVAVQTEYRRQIISWIGLVVFGAVGDVASSIDSFSPDEFKWSGGAGIRFLVDKAERLNIRIDYGLGKDTSGFYFAFSESF